MDRWFHEFHPVVAVVQVRLLVLTPATTVHFSVPWCTVALSQEDLSVRTQRSCFAHRKPWLFLPGSVTAKAADVDFPKLYVCVCVCVSVCLCVCVSVCLCLCLCDGGEGSTCMAVLDCGGLLASS